MAVCRDRTLICSLSYSLRVPSFPLCVERHVNGYFGLIIGEPDKALVTFERPLIEPQDETHLGMDGAPWVFILPERLFGTVHFFHDPSATAQFVGDRQLNRVNILLCHLGNLSLGEVQPMVAHRCLFSQLNAMKARTPTPPMTYNANVKAHKTFNALTAVTLVPAMVSSQSPCGIEGPDWAYLHNIPRFRGMHYLALAHIDPHVTATCPHKVPPLQCVTAYWLPLANDGLRCTWQLDSCLTERSDNKSRAIKAAWPGGPPDVRLTSLR